MKSNKMNHIGYIVSAISMILLIFLETNKFTELLLIWLFTLSIGFSLVNSLHSRSMKEDPDYKIENNDERTEMIRDKTQAMMSMIQMILMAIVATICISIEAYLPAAILGITVLGSPIIMAFVMKYYEGKY